MKINLRAIGDLREYLDKKPREVELPENARVRDLLQFIEQHWGAGFPAYLWDYEKHAFRGPVFLVVNEKVVLDWDAPLQEGMEVRIMRAVAGG
jgi:sulfur carrier protein ThiS